tara:strand:+ start:788 stop:1429 length:642 start_codon:yes stop_codon:yes gene_type:complete
MDNISIIIRNRNEAEYIGFAIQSCLDFFSKPEIIVMNNESNDDSMEVVQYFNDRTNISLQNVINYRPGQSINLAVNKASKDYILILSGHAQITKLDFDLVKKELEEHKAVFGKQVPVYRGKRITPRYIWSNFTDDREINKFSNIENRYFLHNAFCFYAKETLVKYPMPEIYASKEDRYWAKDMVDKKHTYLYDPSIECCHYYTKNGATWKGLG